MRIRVVILPGALEHEGTSSLFPSRSAVLEKLSLRGETYRVKAGPSHVPEAEWLGIGREIELSEGVLAVSAFGADPPERSVHFCLSLMSTDGKCATQPSFLMPAELLREIWNEALRLETSRLILVKGFNLHHGLVWEDGSSELQCLEPMEVEDRGLLQSLPKGDGENMLRRFIDDSINLLSDLEANRVRQEEGLEPVNLLWPWGPGFRPQMPNLTVERGMSVQVESPSPRLKGLCRLVGYRHGDPWSTGTGTNLKLESIASSLQRVPSGLAVVPSIGEFRTKEKHEEASWLGREILGRLVEPLLREENDLPLRLLLIATRPDGEGLAIDFRSDAIREQRDIPFSAEALEEKSLPRVELSGLIAEALTTR